MADAAEQVLELEKKLVKWRVFHPDGKVTYHVAVFVKPKGWAWDDEHALQVDGRHHVGTASWEDEGATHE